MPCSRFILRGFALAALVASGLSVAPLGGAEAAVVYCTGPGVPAGCVVRPTPVIACTRPGYPVGCTAAAPVVRAPVVACTRPGYPVGCTAGADPAARAVARPGPGVNTGGPVNRPGVR